MATILTRNASVYWSAGLVSKTRNVAINLGSDFKEDTVHGSQNKSFAPTFPTFDCKITGLYNTGAAAAGNSAQLIANALSQASATFSVYIGDSNTYFYGSAYISVDNVGAPYDDFAPFDWSLKALGNITHYAK